MDSTLPLYRQLTSRLFLLVFSFFLLFCLGFSFYFQYQQDLAQLKYQQLPAIEQHNQRQLLLIKNDRLLSEIINSQYATNFEDYYKTLNNNLKKISVFSLNNRRLIDQLTHRLKLQSENITLLADNDRRNLQLKDSVIIQLTLITHNLANLISEQSIEQKALYRQVNQDKSTSRIVVNRAMAFSSLIANLQMNRQLHQSLIDTLVMFNQLDLQYDLIEFDYIQLKIQREINDWLNNLTAKVSKTTNENALIEQTSVLNALLFSEQSTFAKWRGQLRMANDLQAELTKQKSELAPLLDKVLVVQPLKSSIVEQQLLAGLAKVNVVLQPEYYIWLIASAFIFISIIFMSLLLSLRRKIEHFGLQSTDVVKEFVTTGEVSTKIPALEVTSIINYIKQLSQPLHSEVDFQQQQQLFKNHNALMSRHTGNIFWQLPIASKILQRQLSTLLGVEPSHNNWCKYFSRDDTRAILSSARKAKKNNIVETIFLISNQGKAIVLTIEYVNNKWCGSLCNVEEYRALKDESAQLQRQLQEQNQLDKLAIIARSDDTLILASNAMVQRQVLSLIHGDEQFAYQQLQQIICCSEQQRTSAQLRRDDFVLTLSTVPLANEIYTALANVSLSQVHSNNFVYLHMADNLATLVTLESELFQAMLSTICQKILTEQQGVELDVTWQVIDVNSAQQTVQVSFLIHQPSHAQTLVRMNNELALNDDVCADDDNTTDNYLRDLQLVFNVSNKASQRFDHGGKFSFDMPLSLAEGLSQTSKKKPTKLAKRSLLVIATEKSSRERICQQFLNSKAVVETMQDLLLFQRQLSIKHLTKNPIDVIILSPEVYVTDYDLITQHLASLPAKLQPKILVVQPFYCKTLQRTGLFLAGNLPWFSDELMMSVEQLINGSNRINLLVEPEIFSPYRFVPSQVEVLVGVAQASKNQALIRVLHWLGLQVTLVSQQQHLERLWKSGRFLVVISEFAGFNLAINDSITTVRGMFALNHNADNKADFLQKLNLPTTWHAEHLAHVLDIQKLTEQLSPWLKPSLGTSENNNALAQVKQRKQNIVPITQTDTEAVTAEQAIDTTDIEPALCFPQDGEVEQESKLIDDAFDLSKYAQNQGSAELAAFMLDDYLTDITANAKALTKALDEKNDELAKQLLQSLVKLAKVIAATPLLMQCEELSQMVSENSVKSDLSSQEKEALQGQLNNLKLCIVELTEFAEAI